LPTRPAGAPAAALCYSNRAATRIVVGRQREALEDCRLAKALDANFTKATVRAARYYQRTTVPLTVLKESTVLRELSSTERVNSTVCVSSLCLHLFAL